MKDVRQSWAIIDENGDEYISASTILFEAAGDVHRAKRIADREARQFRKDHALDGHKITFTVEKRDV